MDWTNNNLLPAILVILASMLASIFTWLIKSRSEELKAINKKLLEERRKNYLEILDPIIRAFVGIKNEAERQKALKDIVSFKYKKTAFEFTFFGSDKVVNAYNALFQHIYKMDENTNQNKQKEMMSLFGKVLLEIRKDLGNKKTALKGIDMLRLMITDSDKIEPYLP